MTTVIFYGAGQNAREKFKYWKNSGVEPVCFADLDIRKHYTIFEGLEVLPLFEAIKRYPDYEIYCTQALSNVDAVYNFLLGMGISGNKIKICEKLFVEEKNVKGDILNKIYERLMDEESKIWFDGRLAYAMTGDKFYFYDALYKVQGDDLFTGWDMGILSDSYYDGKKIIVFGTGKFGEHTYFILKHSKFADSIYAFMDNDAKKWGMKFCGYNILSPSEVVEKHKDAIIIFASEIYCAEMYLQLAHMNFPQYNMFLPQHRKLSGGRGWQYYDVFDAQENEIFIDAGAYDGQTSLDFVRWCNNNYEKIYMFEPSSAMCDIIKAKMEKHNVFKYEIVNKAVWSKDDVLSFSNDINATVATDSCVAECGKYSVETTSIDNILDGKPVTFIKMDVEGSELMALEGAKDTIRRYRPRLAISIYHKLTDIYEIPNYLLELVPDYKFYIRHYSSDVYETILYAE